MPEQDVPQKKKSRYIVAIKTVGALASITAFLAMSLGHVFLDDVNLDALVIVAMMNLIYVLIGVEKKETVIGGLAELLKKLEVRTDG